MAGRLLAAAAVLLTAAACAGAPTTPAPTTTSTVDPAGVCVNQLVYWAKDILGNAKDAGLDYQEMGLDGDTYEALTALIEEARKHQPLPPDWLQDQAKAACTKLAAAKPTTTSGGYGWP